MTPDLKRLCEAVEQVLRGYEVPEYALPADGTEAIVRAVLEELPNIEGGARYAAGGWSRATVTQVVVDILSEPAKA